MRILTDMANKEVTIEDDNGGAITVDYEIYSDACDHIRSGVLWKTQVALLFEEVVGKLLLDATALHVRQEAEEQGGFKIAS
jgi:hypothetical protein